ncbi:hypothetical protein PC128_g27452 [Phytophthora cactorum]|nr:hypothetical protein PC117_g24406 [Phytophthora cactorum]KAG2986433.1 hypothetical protein PC120_g23836 [Phytophthora cactorum]KAG3124640.1 hypothetical protein PC128_g27452 [Phytophthora cactorum]KAG3127503.1 hypothetical protein C6341_g24957 [Phytophthora cactorum]
MTTVDEVKLEDILIKNAGKRTAEDVEPQRGPAVSRGAIGSDQGSSVCGDRPGVHISLGLPVVVIIKKNGVDIRIYIDDRLVNSLTRLMVHLLPLSNGLLEDLDKVRWFCSLDMESRLSERLTKLVRSQFHHTVRIIRMAAYALGLKNAPKIYQRPLDNALYGYLRISNDSDQTGTTDIFQTGVADSDSGPPVLRRRS